MKSIINEITALRGGRSLVIDYRNRNRYEVIAAEEDGTKTAYCFGVPIYNRKTRKLVDLRFCESENGWQMSGSDALVTVTDSVFLENAEGFCKLKLSGDMCVDERVGSAMADVSPSLNGVRVCVPCSVRQTYKVKLISGRPFMNVRANDRCFSLMAEEFRPFVTLSCIGVQDGAGQIIAPCRLGYQKDNDQTYTIRLQHDSPYGAKVVFELNLYEEKLIQDTTVESLHPDVNNAFGGAAFIGNTAAYGEQWLYARPDFAKVSELYDKQLLKVILHLPRFGGRAALSAFGLTARFCSFGSKWENKIGAAKTLTDAFSSSGYQSLDLTRFVTDHAQYLTHFEGFILKPKEKGNGFCAVSTGDSYAAPPILEINYQS